MDLGFSESDGSDRLKRISVAITLAPVALVFLLALVALYVLPDRNTAVVFIIGIGVTTTIFGLAAWLGLGLARRSVDDVQQAFDQQNQARKRNREADDFSDLSDPVSPSRLDELVDFGQLSTSRAKAATTLATTRASDAEAHSSPFQALELIKDAEANVTTAATRSPSFAQVELERVRALPETTVEEQNEAIKQGISTVSINLARRIEGMVDRQIELIDRLEQHDQDPGRLETVFGIDHLANRMRRNSESLRVLAGDDPVRRRRGEPVTVRDVLRIAFGQIEEYDRVRLGPIDDAQVVPQRAPEVAHMVAELVENSTQFSPPDTVVLVEGVLDASGGYTVTINDQGIGMTDDALAAANVVLSDPPDLGPGFGRSLGFSVTGRLARRMKASVTLSRGSQKGTEATIRLPRSVLVEDSLPQPDIHFANADRLFERVVPAATPAGTLPPRALAELHWPEPMLAPEFDLTPPPMPPSEFLANPTGAFGRFGDQGYATYSDQFQVDEEASTTTEYLPEYDDGQQQDHESTPAQNRRPADMAADLSSIAPLDSWPEPDRLGGPDSTTGQVRSRIPNALDGEGSGDDAVLGLLSQRLALAGGARPTNARTNLDGSTPSDLPSAGLARLLGVDADEGGGSGAGLADGRGAQRPDSWRHDEIGAVIEGPPNHDLRPFPTPFDSALLKRGQELDRRTPVERLRGQVPPPVSSSPATASRRDPAEIQSILSTYRQAIRGSRPPLVTTPSAAVSLVPDLDGQSQTVSQSPARQVTGGFNPEFTYWGDVVDHSKNEAS